MLILRADAGLAIGTGHVMRMLALGQAWLDQGGEACLAYAECPANLLLRLKNEGILAFRMPHPPGSPRDCESLCQLARGHSRPALVVDGYHFSGEYMAGLASSGVDHAILDDIGFTSGSEALLVINPNLAASAAFYPGLPPGKVLAGPHYALLRREFRKAGRGDSDGPARRLLVTFGGSDPGNYSARVLREVCGMVAECQVVCGAANPHLAELKELARGAAGACRVEIREDVADMSEPMRWADVAVAAAGSTALEMAAMGLPAVYVAVADNQSVVGKGIQAFGTGLFAGEGREGLEAVPPLLAGLVADASARNQLSRNGREVVDGQGALRVASKLREVFSLS